LGVTGIADSANFSGVSIFGIGNSPAKAIKTAADKLNKGDIILIELHRPGPNATGQGQFGFIAIEWWSADFAAVQYAIAKGIIVIAAAGNGSQNLDDAVYLGRFDRNQRDSGALLIGAGAPPSGTFGADRSRLGFSNYGQIIDAQGWGREVVSAGYGGLQGGANKNRWYTQTFSGTSSASPIVVGAAACLQGIQKARGGQPLTYTELRHIFRTTGSSQTDGPAGPKTQRIGNRPDLKAAVPKQQIKSGTAAKYWIELVAYPPGSDRSLWLYVNSAWKRLDNPSASIQDAVQRAFLGTGSNVQVWYDNGVIVGLVVEGS
jgi:subtilisin family serine protease